jgi:DNA-binding LytR/AlgR family response regulator
MLRIHKSYAVNLSRVREIVRRDQGAHWQLRLQPPAGKILPIGKKYLKSLWKAYGG